MLAGASPFINSCVVPRRNWPVRLPGLQQGGRREIGPVERRFIAQFVAQIAHRLRAGADIFRELRRIHQFNAGRHFQAAGAADHQQALDAGLFDRGEDLLGAAEGFLIQVVFAQPGL